MWQSVDLVAYMLSCVEMASDLVRRARQTAGLSARSLAGRARVPTSTVTRVESGQVDPTLGMLRRLLDGAGQELRVGAEPARRGPTLADLADAWIDSPEGGRPDWTRLRSFLDFLVLHPRSVATAIVRRPAASRSPVMDSLLAGVAEKLADDAGMPRPSWAGRTPRLRETWSVPGTPRMTAVWRAAAPAQLLRRGLVIDAASLWRDHEIPLV